MPSGASGNRINRIRRNRIMENRLLAASDRRLVRTEMESVAESNIQVRSDTSRNSASRFRFHDVEHN